MKMTNTKAVAAVAALGVGLLVVLAAVPSQTDFSGTYFQTNTLPISLVGSLTNWAKLSTNAISAGAGNVVNTGASVAGMFPVYTDVSGTAVTPTNALDTLDVTTALTLSGLTANSLAGFGASTNLTNITASSDFLLSGTSLALSNTTVNAGSYTAANITVDAKGRVTAAASGTTVGSIGVTTDGGGSAITTGVKGYIVVPYTGHITGWSIVSDGSSPTCTWDVWKVASGTALPAVGNTITGSQKPALSSGNAARSIAINTWGSGTNLTAGDIIGFNVDAAATGTRITLTLETLR